MAANIKYRTADGFTQLIGNQTDIGTIVSLSAAEVDVAPIKICLENIGDRALGAGSFSALLLKRVQVGTNTGVNFVFTSDGDPNGTISKPWGLGVDINDVLTGAPVATLTGPYGSWASTGTKGAVVTALNATGETIASVEVTFIVASLSDEFALEWEDTPDATDYNVYVTDTPGTYGASTFFVNVPYSNCTLDGSATSSGTPPLANTTGGAGPSYGTAPVLGDFTAADKTIAVIGDGGLAVGQQWFFWFDAKVPAGSTSLGNKRAMKLFPKEV